MKQLDLYLDFKSPAAYLAMPATRQLMAETGVQISWRPFNTRQRNLTEKKASETKSESHLRVREESRRQIHLRYADVLGLPMRFRVDSGQSDCALSALLYLRDDPSDYIEAAFHAYWVDHLDLDDRMTVANLLHATGYDGSGFLHADLAGEVETSQLQAVERGVIDTPCYAIGSQLFVGREHMLWIKQMIGESGESER